VLGNLLENALKYSDPGSSVGIEVTVEPDGVRCVVRDAGVGIPAEDLPQLFDSFYRGKNVGTVSGTGLGLAVVKRAVDVQHGRIDVHSECGRGTTVTVWLPLGAADAAPGAAPARASDAPLEAPANQPSSPLPLA
jgi:signal transduction histidine kinase